MTSLELRQINKNYGAYHALRGIDLSVAQGEFIVMVGPSGCGKSTLLKSIAGLEEISSGQILINGRDVSKQEPGDRGIAMVFQSYALYPHMTVAENMGFGLRMAKRPKAEIEAAVARAAKILRITDQLEKRPKQLSGGQRQRVAIGRAITRSPDVFLFDEPLSNLDAALRTQMRVELSSLHAELGATMVYVTHDQVEAMTMASRIVVLNQGVIEQVGSPLELYRNPDNLFVAGFLGAPRMNFLGVTVDEVSGRNITVSAPGLVPVTVELAEATVLPKGASLTLGVRPENISMVADGAQGGAINGQVRLVEHLGRETILYVDAGNLRTIASESGTGNITVQLSYVAPFAADQNVALKLDASELYLFSPDGGRTISARKTILDR
ncbi:sn-glycerol-3-phosphate ABC transporter ATP-binding protein UgpC [Rhizobium leguminosarum bv. trifolii]|jgi:multiple sugar transport system ATP-binding protein|uniref:Sn-glycerol-3-phosphate ABC transporter ATP-binding protein UgpC n=1 Tax=Rhizobium ruizarguesonis TaxID=2081791 RepID=A0AAE5C1S6_9HYPH|nr:sn-glycerol-3-phosphate ABC transporter ATP-binding protein UgpC [Rhizobium ruizarguesonis]MBY5802640.1 sn-glycerol-3-phosphate ABC transporter ATP-binding protein UgpC [Rhizobium leguminosarum]NKL12301.1 sn-glycerol-3-phosphate ABC transporter ATP-binding protein UgpC [Rhizobium leguminosarum bv. viciae]QIO42739.1 sn-glycerol-3-phosphate ABC transporter ATP-binding protein UgpC [Rhizobium leguminosarum bv. trifolii]MBY5843640.1 sn-glycerol-3-phosphate ABC transporter ATP-binding protein Ugp